MHAIFSLFSNYLARCTLSSFLHQWNTNSQWKYSIFCLILIYSVRMGAIICASKEVISLQSAGNLLPSSTLLNEWTISAEIMNLMRHTQFLPRLRTIKLRSVRVERLCRNLCSWHTGEYTQFRFRFLSNFNGELEIAHIYCFEIETCRRLVRYFS